MIDKNVLLAQFWANNNQLVTEDGIELELNDDETIVISIVLKNAAGNPYEIQIVVEFDPDAFAAEMELQLMEDLLEFNLDTLFALLMGRKARYRIVKA
ncbi:hypothetical protein D3C87_1263760 [compost metagenome]